MTKMLVFDMDGTIADLYGVNGWLEMLRAYDETPYRVAKPMYDMMILNELLRQLQRMGYKVAVTTWLSKESTKEYDEKVRKAKLEWLAKYNFPYDEIHLVKYGTTKANCTRGKADYQILFDDNANVRKGWTLGETFDANENICKKLVDIISQM